MPPTKFRSFRNKGERENSSAITRTRSEEEYINRDVAQLNNTVIHITSGESTYRPSSDYLKRRGVKSMLFFSTDTYTLSAWTGTEWKSVTLS